MPSIRASRPLALAAAAGLATALLAGCGSSSEGGDQTTSTAVEATTTAAGTGTAGRDEIAKEVGRYQPAQLDERIYLLVPPGATDQQLIDVAKAWHQREPEADLQLFDDDAEIPTILKLLPKTERGDTTGFPAEWVTEHQVARLQRFVNTDKPWKLGRGTSVDYQDTLIELD